MKPQVGIRWQPPINVHLNGIDLVRREQVGKLQFPGCHWCWNFSWNQWHLLILQRIWKYKARKNNLYRYIINLRYLCNCIKYFVYLYLGFKKYNYILLSSSKDFLVNTVQIAFWGHVRFRSSRQFYNKRTFYWIFLKRHYIWRVFIHSQGNGLTIKSI